MAQATLPRVLQEIKPLNAEELRRVQHALESQLTPASHEAGEEAFLQAMLDTGLISEIKRPDRSRDRARRLAPSYLCLHGTCRFRRDNHCDTRVQAPRLAPLLVRRLPAAQPSYRTRLSVPSQLPFEIIIGRRRLWAYTPFGDFSE